MGVTIEHVHTIEHRTVKVRRTRLLVEKVDQQRIVCTCGYVSHWRTIGDAPFRRPATCTINGQQSFA